MTVIRKRLCRSHSRASSNSPQVTKGQYIANAPGTCEQHDKAINTTSPSSCCRESPLQSLKVTLINLASLANCMTKAQLVLKLAALFKRRILLFVCINHFLALDKELTARGNTLAGYRVCEGFGEWRKALGWVDDEGRFYALRFNVNAAKLIKETGEGRIFGDLEGKSMEEGADLVKGVRGTQIGQLLVNSFFDAGDEVDTLEGCVEVDLGRVEGIIIFVECVNASCHSGEKFFASAHQIFQVGVGVIEFAGGELCIVGFIKTWYQWLVNYTRVVVMASIRHTFIAKRRANLKYFIESQEFKKLYRLLRRGDAFSMFFCFFVFFPLPCRFFWLWKESPTKRFISSCNWKPASYCSWRTYT